MIVMEKYFDQLVFCDTEDPVIGTDPGVDLAASSFSPGEQADQYWRGLLKPLVSVPPRATLCYLIADNGQAALMHRTIDTRTRREAFVHVLIGPRNEMTPKIALGSFRWDWSGAIKEPGDFSGKTLKRVTGESRVNFLERAEDGWSWVAREGEPPAELFQLIAEISEKGGAEDGPLSFDDQSPLFSLGTSNFAIVRRKSSEPTDSVPLPVQVLVKLLVMLGGSGDDDLSKGIIGSGFSTYEHRYRVFKTTLPRWVFATEIDTGPFELTGLEVNLRNTASEGSYRPLAESFISNFKNALDKNRSPQVSDTSPGPGPENVNPGEPSQAGPDLTDVERETSEATSRPEFDETEFDEIDFDGQSAATATRDQPIPDIPPPPGADGEDHADTRVADLNSKTVPPKELEEGVDRGAGDTTFDSNRLASEQWAQTRDDSVGEETEAVSADGVRGRSDSPDPGTPSGPGPQLPVRPPRQVPTYSPYRHDPSDHHSGVSAPRPQSGAVSAQRQQGPIEFVNLSDEQLVEKLGSFSDDEFDFMVASFQSQARRHQGEIQQGVIVDLASVREYLINEEFAAQKICEFEYEWQVRMYTAICEFAISDKPAGSDGQKQAVARLIRALASNNMSKAPIAGKHGRISYAYPLVAAMMTIIPHTEDDKIVYEFVPIFKSSVGGRRGELLGYEFEPAPKAEKHEELPVAEPRYPWATGKSMATLAAALIIFVLICVCIGNLP